MLRKIFFKEYKKMRLFLLGALLINMGATAKLFINMKSSFAVSTTVNVWMQIIEKNSIFYTFVVGIMHLTAVAVGVYQFLPEVDKKRFRISCHLPLKEGKMIALMVLAGVTYLSVIALLDAFCVLAITSFYFPSELSKAVSVLFIKDYYSIIALYLYAVVITLEPNKLRKALLIVAFMPLNFIFSRGSGYNSFDGQWLPYLLSILIIIPIILSPAYRFRKGDF